MKLGNIVYSSLRIYESYIFYSNSYTNIPRIKEIVS